MGGLNFLKLEVDFSSDEKIQELESRIRGWGTGTAFYLLVIAQVVRCMPSLKSEPEVTLGLQEWARRLGGGIHPNKVLQLFEACANVGLLEVEVTGGGSAKTGYRTVRVRCDKILDVMNQKGKSGKSEVEVVKAPAKAKDKQGTKQQDEGPQFSQDSHAYKLSMHLLQRIKANNPKAKEPKNLQRWAADMDKILRIDQRDPQEVKQVIDWCQSDEFWYTNILSPAKLRKQYDKLYPKAKKLKPKKNFGPSDDKPTSDQVSNLFFNDPAKLAKFKFDPEGEKFLESELAVAGAPNGNWESQRAEFITMYWDTLRQKCISW